MILILRTPKRYILTPNHVFWAMIRQNPLQIVVSRRVDETRRGSSRKKVKKAQESGAVYFIHMGSRSRRTDRYEIWHFTSSDRRYYSLKIWYRLVQQFWLWRGVKFALSQRNTNPSLPHATLLGFQVINYKKFNYRLIACIHNYINNIFIYFHIRKYMRANDQQLLELIAFFVFKMHNGILFSISISKWIKNQKCNVMRDIEITSDHMNSETAILSTRSSTLLNCNFKMLYKYMNYPRQ